MARHVSLQVEVSELLALLNLQKDRQLGIRDNLAAIQLVLQVILSDVLVDVLGHLSARHLRPKGLLQKLGKLVTDSGGLHETTGSTGPKSLLLLGALLGGDLEVSAPLLLQHLVFRLQGVNEGSQLLQLGHELGGLLEQRMVQLGGFLDH